MQIGTHELSNNLFVAPMAGVTDRPFRALCRRLGAGYAVSEMVASNTALYASRKSQRRMDHSGEEGPIAAQIAGAEPAMMAEAARINVDCGAHIIDINMGCPAKKVCRAWAGSALLSNELLVARIVEAVVNAVPVPVTLKFRTGPDRGNTNAVRVARIAEAAGVRMLTLHGRSRACGFKGTAEYDTIRAVKEAVRIPVVANGDIDSPAKARQVIDATGADALMIGRAAQGRPWIFREILHHLATGGTLPPPTVAEARSILLAHLVDHYEFYGESTGVRTARKHILWYTRSLAGATRFRAYMNTLDSTTAQIAAVADFFDEQAVHREHLLYEDAAANDDMVEALAA
ncbi:MAG: tRNA dihydrouridine synthase DusB [Burkholderiales bacterium]